MPKHRASSKKTHVGAVSLYICNVSAQAANHSLMPVGEGGVVVVGCSRDAGCCTAVRCQRPDGSPGGAGPISPDRRQDPGVGWPPVGPWETGRQG